jgi:hypothetical protein
MAKGTESVSHPVLGDLVWLPDSPEWFAQLRLPGGAALDLAIEPGGEGRHAFLEPAADLFAWAVANERRVLREAIREELLGLYNDEGWRQDDDPQLTAGELEGRLEWQSLELSGSDVAPVRFGYDAGELFGGHPVFVELGADLKYRDLSLGG